MPKVAREFSALDVRRLAHTGIAGNKTVAVGGVSGLLMQITPTGSKQWLLRTTVGTDRRIIGLGGYPAVTLAQARERARETLDQIRRGVDPVEERKAVKARLAAAQARGMTFADAADRYLSVKLDEFRSAKHAAQWRNTLDSYALPALGKMLVADIAPADVQRALAPIWTTKTETATRLRQRIEAVLSWATVAGHRSGDNPARWRGNLDALLPKPGKVAEKDNHPALALADVPRWWEALQARQGIAAQALAFLAMTAARSGEVRGATWGEFDLQAGLWTIAGSRMKAGREHTVPLPPEAVNFLRRLPRMTGADLVFPAPRGGTLSDMTISAAMKRMQEAELERLADLDRAAGREPSTDPRGFVDPRSKRPAVPHGLRSTFRQWAAERGYDRDMAELALAHNVGTAVERRYQRSDMVERRRGLMAAWGRFLRGEDTPTVVSFAEARV